MSIQEKWDYVARYPYKPLRRILRASGFRRPKGFSWEHFWQNLGRELERTETCVVTMNRINPYSPSTYLVAFVSTTPIHPSNTLNVVKETNPDRAKAVCALLNSAIFLAQFFLLKEESTGRYMHIRFYDLYEMPLFPSDVIVPDLVAVFDQFAHYEFPSLREQLDQGFDQRYEDFWSEKRSGQPSLLSILREPVEPSPVRLDFDLAICNVLGVSITRDELSEVYSTIVKEMVVTRGLRRD